MKQFGEFSQTGNEYIIYRADTPKPWVNVISNGRYTMRVTQAGAGFSYLNNNSNGAVTRAGDAAAADQPGRYVYIRDNDSGELWSLTGQPVQKKTDHWQARHGLGYTTVESATEGVESSVTYFVPLEDPCEIWQVALTNLTERKRRLSIFVLVEWAESEDGGSLETVFKSNAVFASERGGSRLSYLSLSHQADSFDCFKASFFGRGGSLNQPAAVTEGRCSRSSGFDAQPVGVLQRNITLGPNADAHFNVFVGGSGGETSSAATSQQRRTAEILKVIKHYQTPGAVATALETVREYWAAYTTRTLVKTPDRKLDLAFNYWVKYQGQTAVRAPLARYSLQAKTGVGERAQAVLGILPDDPTLAKTALEELLTAQPKEVPSAQADDWQWLVTAVIFYVKETGDLDFLRQHCPYGDSGSGSVLEHVNKIIQNALKHLSSRHFQYQVAADWSAALSHGEEKRAESVIETARLAYNLREFCPLLDAVGEHELVSRLQRHYHQLKTAINRHGWDGAWYRAGRSAEGRILGTKSAKEHQLNLEAQTWAVLAGVAEQDRGTKAMNSVWKRLQTKFGPAVFLPAYAEADPTNPLSLPPPGSGRNAAISNEAVARAVVAETLLGRGDQAYQLLQQAAFTYREPEPEAYQTEPYAFAEFVYGPGHARFGQGAGEHINNAGGWFYRAFLDHVVGLQPVLGGLKIDPCLPRDWRHVEVTRQFRGAQYHIRIQNPTRVSKGVDRILVDGVRLTGTVVTPFNAGVHFVEVFLG